MSFSSILKEIVEGTPGAIGCALMGVDGIPIEQQVAGSPAARDFEEELGAAGVEFGRILQETRKASDTLGGGALREIAVNLARFTLVFHVVDEDHFLVMALLPDGNLGKARYLLRRHLRAVRDEF